MSEMPKFLRDLDEKYAAVVKEIAETRMAWKEAQAAIKKFPGWELTGERREPKKDDWFLAEGGMNPSPVFVNPGFESQWKSEPRFILRKVEPAPEPERSLPEFRGASICPNCGIPMELRGIYVKTCTCKSAAEPDREPSPRVVWGCPKEVLQLIEEIYHSSTLTQEQNERFIRLDSLCRAAREATVEEVSDACLEWFLVNPKSAKTLIGSLHRAGIRLMKEEKP